MPSLDDLKKRIKSVKSTQKITKAMKMVAAAKLRKAQESAEKGRPYSEKLQNIILNLTKSISDPNNAPKLLVGTGKDETHLCVVMTADRGLCGGFNANIASSVTIADNTGSYTLKTNNGKKLFTAKDKNGDELFDGPVDNEKQRDALDRNLIKKLEQLEGMGNGKEGIQLRQFRFNGGRAIPRDLDFRFDLKPGDPAYKPAPERPGRIIFARNCQHGRLIRRFAGFRGLGLVHDVLTPLRCNIGYIAAQQRKH